MLGSDARTRTAAAGEGRQHVLDRDVAGHAVVRRDLSLAVKPVAEVEVPPS